MHRFKKRFGRLTGQLSSVEASVLGDLVDQVRSLLAERRAEHSVDPLADLTGMAMGSAEAPQDAAVRRLLPDFHASDADLAAGLRQLHEPALIAAKDTAAVTLLDSLPRGGGTVRLDEQQAVAWMTALNDVRLAIAERIGLNDDDEEPAALADGDEAVHTMWHTYQWLTMVLDSLVVASME